MDEATRSAWSREQGLYPAELDAWKQDAIAGLGEPRATSAVEAPQDWRIGDG
jgi:transposase